MKKYDLSRISARWLIRLEFANRPLALFFRLLQIGMFCKIFDLPKYGYVIFGSTSILAFFIVGWVLDKRKALMKVDNAHWQRSDAWTTLFRRLNEIENKLSEIK